MSQTYTHITSTHIECTSCKKSQIVEMFTLLVSAIPIPQLERKYGPVSLDNKTESRSYITSRYYCEDCGVVYVSTEKNKLAKNHDDREMSARKYFEKYL